MERDDRTISFVAKHYRKGAFSVDKAWGALGIGVASKWRRLRVAAAVAAIVVISATAAVVYYHYEPAPGNHEVETEIETPPRAEAVRIIDFENASLPDVVDKIAEVYGVKIVNLPENAEAYKLSLRYEGTAEDLVTTINEILETDLSIE